MKHIFFFLGLLPLMVELFTVFNPMKVQKFSEKVKSLKSGEKLEGNMLFFATCMLFYMAWTFVGLLSSQWVICLTLLLLTSLRGLIGLVTRSVIVLWFDSLISTFLVGFAIINAIHLHINLFTLLKSWI